MKDKIETFDDWDDEAAYRFAAQCEHLIETDGYLNLDKAFSAFDKEEIHFC